MNTDTRIQLDDNMYTAMVKMSEGNPGAITALIESAKSCASIDPDSFLADLSVILALDTLGIYGSKIWMLYKDVCKMDMVNMVGVLRANQLGFLSETDLFAAINGESGKKLDIAGLLEKVRAELPNFKR